MIAVSLENIAVVVYFLSGRSEMYKRYKNGPNILSYGTPDSIGINVMYSS